MPNAMQTRRAALGALAVVPALAIPAVPAIASPATAGPDAELFELIEAARKATAHHDAAIAALEEAENRAEEEAPPWPPTLIATEEDTRLWRWNPKPGDAFTPAQLKQMSQKTGRQGRGTKWSAILANGPWSEKDRAMIGAMVAAEARKDQLIPAFEEWNELKRLAEERAGVPAAAKREGELHSEQYDARMRVANARAQTLAGMLAKLAFIAPSFDDESASEISADLGTTPAILYSVAADYKTLAI
jgi:hypothetical protein